MKKGVVILVVMFVFSFGMAKVQSYRQSVGITAGLYNGLNSKVVFGANLALDGTLAYGWVGDVEYNF